MTALILPTSHDAHDTQRLAAGGDSSPNQTSGESNPTRSASGSDVLRGGQPGFDTHSTLAAALPLHTSHQLTETQSGSAGGEPSPNPTSGESNPTRSASGSDVLRGGQPAPDTQERAAAAQPLPTSQRILETHVLTAGGGPSPTNPTIRRPNPTVVSSGWLELRVWADLFDDAQRTRIAAENRVRSSPNPDPYRSYLDQVAATEHSARLALRRCYRRVVPDPIKAFQAEQKGVGVDLLARLLGHLGDPCIAEPHAWVTDPPDVHVCDPLRCGDNRHLVAYEPFQRTVAQLWAYCGHGDPTRTKRKGMSADDALGLGNPMLKKLVWLNAVACMKSTGHYRNVYSERRDATAERVHATPCVRCGPSGRPAAEGSPWSKAHQHADALRIVGKQILCGLWVAQNAATQSGPGTHATLGGGEALKEAS